MQDLVEQLSALLEAQNMMLVSAESCTGGSIASNMTQRSGSSKVFERGYVTYSNAAKVECLGVNQDTLNEFGAVSAQTAAEMADGALKNSHAQIAVSVTGIAGPDSDDTNKPVGLVYFGFTQDGQDTKTIEKHFNGSRSEIQSQSVEFALKTLLEWLS